MSFSAHPTVGFPSNAPEEGKQLVTGQAYAMQGAGMHALQNKADVPVVFLEVDLP